MGDEGSARVPEVGEVLAGKYRLTRLIGEGGMGVVLCAEHLGLRQSLAIKFLNPDLVGTEEIVKRFAREARAAAKLRNRHVVRVSDVEATPEGLPYIVMELLEGRDLETERNERKKIPFAEVVDWVLQACAALDEAHTAGIVHRDLKPSNLFLARETQDAVVVKVLDFGISKFIREEDSKLTSAGSIVGTILYMSPEQIRGKAIDGRSDVWSLGVILYELLTGETPWVGNATKVSADIVSDPPPDIRQKVALPEELTKTIEAMLEKSVAKRVQSVAAVVARLAPFAPKGSVGAEVAAAMARRSARSIVSAVPAPPTPEVDVDARTEAQHERSTIAATTSSGIPARQRTLGFIALVALVTVGAVVATLVVTRAPTPPVIAEPPAASKPPSVASASETKGEPLPLASASVPPLEEPSAKLGEKKRASSPPPPPKRPGASPPPAASTAGSKPAASAQPTNPLFIP